MIIFAIGCVFAALFFEPSLVNNALLLLVALALIVDRVFDHFVQELEKQRQ